MAYGCCNLNQKEKCAPIIPDTRRCVTLKDVEHCENPVLVLLRADAHSMVVNRRSSVLTCGSPASSASRATTRRAVANVRRFDPFTASALEAPSGLHLRYSTTVCATADIVNMAGDLKLKFAIDRGGTFTDVFCEVLMLILLIILGLLCAAAALCKCADFAEVVTTWSSARGRHLAMLAGQHRTRGAGPGGPHLHKGHALTTASSEPRHSDVYVFQYPE